MTAIKQSLFKGEIPRIGEEAPLNLPAEHAREALNCKVTSTGLEAFKGLRRVWRPSKAGTIRSIYRFGATQGRDADGAITGVSDTSPVRITSAGHGLATGDQVFVAGTGLGIDNATYVVTVTGANTFILNGTSAAGAAAAGYWTRLNGYWFHWIGDVDVIRGPISGDTSERTYYADGVKPKMTYGSLPIMGGGTNYPINSYDLGIPAPKNSPVISVPTFPVTMATSASPVVITSPGHGLVEGDTIYLDELGGMRSVNGLICQVKNPTTHTFKLYNYEGTAPIDGTGDTYTGGGYWYKVDPGVTLTDQQERHYVYTYVSGLGEEGPPSPPSAALTWSPPQTVTVGSMDTGPSTGSYNLTHKRIYRMATGSNGNSEYQFVAEVALSTTSYHDDVEVLGEVIPSTLWDPPPDDLHGLGLLPSGVAYGVSRNRLCMSEPSLPHAWPATYQRVANHEFVGAGHFQDTVVAVTTAKAYIAQGYDPRSTRLMDALEQGCVAKRSIVSIDNVGVVYASPDGLILIGPGGAQIATQDYLRPEEWRALNPRSLHACAIDGYYMAFYTAVDGTRAGFIFDPKPGGLGFMQLDTYATACWRDLLTDAVYLVVDGYIERWDGLPSERIAYRWKSKPHRVGVGGFARAMVVAEDYSDITFRYYSDGALRHTETVAGDAPFPLPAHDWAEAIEYEIEGTSTVQRVALAESLDELEGF